LVIAEEEEIEAGDHSYCDVQSGAAKAHIFVAEELHRASTSKGCNESEGKEGDAAEMVVGLASSAGIYINDKTSCEL
jgi:hypothetical protein